VLRGLTRVEDDLPPVPVERLRDRRHDQAEVAAKWIAGTAYHCYSGDPSKQTDLHNAFPSKGIWFTECSGSHGPTDTPPQIFRGTLTWHARTLMLGTTRNWAKSVVNWNIALDSTGGPHLGGCDTCTGLVTVQPDGTITTDAEYYTIGHLSKFVRPGAVRIGSTSYGTTGWNGQLMSAAFRNPDGSTVWTSKQAQAPGQSRQVDLGSARFFRQVALDSGGQLGDFAAGRNVATSNDGVHWSSPVSGRSTGQLTTVNLRPTVARYLRVTSTATSDHWWSLADLRLYR